MRGKSRSRYVLARARDFVSTLSNNIRERNWLCVFGLLRKGVLLEHTCILVHSRPRPRPCEHISGQTTAVGDSYSPIAQKRCTSAKATRAPWQLCGDCLLDVGRRFALSALHESWTEQRHEHNGPPTQCRRTGGATPMLARRALQHKRIKHGGLRPNLCPRAAPSQEQVL